MFMLKIFIAALAASSCAYAGLLRVTANTTCTKEHSRRLSLRSLPRVSDKVRFISLGLSRTVSNRPVWIQLLVPATVAATARDAPACAVCVSPVAARGLAAAVAALPMPAAGLATATPVGTAVPALALLAIASASAGTGTAQAPACAIDVPPTAGESRWYT